MDFLRGLLTQIKPAVHGFISSTQDIGASAKTVLDGTIRQYSPAIQALIATSKVHGEIAYNEVELRFWQHEPAARALLQEAATYGDGAQAKLKELLQQIGPVISNLFSQAVADGLQLRTQLEDVALNTSILSMDAPSFATQKVLSDTISQCKVADLRVAGLEPTSITEFLEKSVSEFDIEQFGPTLRQHGPGAYRLMADLFDGTLLTAATIENMFCAVLNYVEDNPVQAAALLFMFMSTAAPELFFVPFLDLLGFTSIGPAAGGAAALFQSRLGPVLGFRLAQSAAMGGRFGITVLGVATQTIGVGIGSAVALLMSNGTDVSVKTLDAAMAM